MNTEEKQKQEKEKDPPTPVKEGKPIKQAFEKQNQSLLRNYGDYITRRDGSYALHIGPLA